MDANNDYGISTPEHLETMFEAITDTMDGVTGSEGFGLTRAQQYSFAVLGASDEISYQQRVGGNESFFGAIGDGLKALWNYIMKMFNGISAFFFGSSENSAENKVKKATAKVDANIEALKSINVNKMVEANIAPMKARLKASLTVGATDGIPHNELSAAHAILDKAIAKHVDSPAATAPVEEVKALKEVAEKLARLNRRQKEHLMDQVNRVNKITEEFNTAVMKDESAQFEGTEFQQMYHSFRDNLQDSNALDIGAFARIHDIKDAIAAQTIIQRMLTRDVNGQRLFIVQQKGPIINKVKLLEKQLVSAGQGKGAAFGNEPQFRKDLTACKIFLSLTTRLAKQIDACDEGLTQISNTIMQLFGMKAA